MCNLKVQTHRSREYSGVVQGLGVGRVERQALSNRDQALSNKINKFWGTLYSIVVSCDHKQINKFLVVKDYIYYVIIFHINQIYSLEKRN